MTRYLSVVFLIGAIGIGVGLPQIYPALSFTPLTARAEGVPHEHAMLKALSVGDALLFAFPDYTYFPYVSSGRKPLYVGAIMFLLSVLAIAYLCAQLFQRTLATRYRIPAVLAILALLCLALSLKHSPLSWALQALPVFEYFRFPFRWMFLGALFFSILGAFAYEHFYTLRTNRFARGALIAVLGIEVGIVAGIALLQALSMQTIARLGDMLSAVFLHTFNGRFGFTKGFEHYSSRIDAGLLAWCEFTALSDLSFLCAYLMLATSLALMLAALKDWVSRRFFMRAVPVMVYLSFCIVFAVQWPTTGSYNQLLAHSEPLQEAFSELGEHFRIYPFYLDYEYGMIVPPQFKTSNDEIAALSELSFASGWPNFNFFYAIPSVDGYDQFVPENTVDALAHIGSTFAAAESTAMLDARERIQALTEGIDVLSIMGGRYVISGIPIHHASLKGRAEFTTPHGPRVYVYENTAARPVSYFAPSVVHLPHNGISDLLRHTGGRLGGETYIDCSGCANGSGSPGLISTEEEKNGFVRFRVEASGGWLIVNHTYLPGWHAYVDGVSVPIRRANGLFMGVFVPSGGRMVAFEYRGIHNEARLLRSFGLYPDRVYND